MLKGLCWKKTYLLIMAVCAVVMAAGVRDVSAGDEDYIGEISWFAGNYAPINTAFCDGQLLPISQYQALFAVIGCQYGGNCQTNFALPDMRGRVPMHWGTGPGLTARRIAETGGTEQASLQLATVSVEPADPRSATVVNVVRGDTQQPHNNMQPYLATTCTIALNGIFPPRN